MKPWKNVFDSNICLPHKVCIVAPGPNGLGRYAEIPPDYLIVAVSKAVLIPELNPKFWLMNHVDQPWLFEAMNSFRHIRVFHEDAVDALQKMGHETSDNELKNFFFKPPPEPLGLKEFMPVDGCIRIGATISACALQFAYNFGAKDIVLCGVDMSGDEYFDGSVNRNPNHGETWPATSRLNALIDWMVGQRDLRITTLSPTKLEVPTYQ